jgi:hypothetical protein
MGPYIVCGHLSICEDANKRIERIVGECAAVIGEKRRARRVIRQNIWEQRPRDALRLSRRISTGVLQGVREGGKETPIVCWRTSEVGVSFFYKYDRLRRPRSALNLDPTAAITRRKRARPQADLFSSQSRVRYFKNDAAHIFVSEKIVASEL